MAAIEARRHSRSPEPEQGFLVNRSGLCDAPALLLVSPVIPRITSAGEHRLSPASQQTSQPEETQQTPASPILSDHYGPGKGRAGWIHRPVLQIVRWLLGEADSR